MKVKLLAIGGIISGTVYLIFLLSLLFGFIDLKAENIGVVARNDFINVRVPWGDSIQVFLYGSNSEDVFMYFATTGYGAVVSAWIDTIDATTAGQDFIKFRDQVSDMVPTDSSAGQYALSIMSWNSDAATLTDFTFTMVDSSLSRSLERAYLGADSVMAALVHNNIASLIRIFNTLDSAEYANLIYSRFDNDMAALQRIAGRNGVPCDTSLQVLHPNDGSVPKDSVQFFCQTGWAPDVFTWRMTMIFHHNNQTNVVDSVTIETPQG